jgi:hypothetical protein
MFSKLKLKELLKLSNIIKYHEICLGVYIVDEIRLFFFGKNIYTCMFHFFLERHEQIDLFWLEILALSRAYSKFDNLLLALYHTSSWHLMSSCCVVFSFLLKWNKGISPKKIKRRFT